jgi:hypothetical protein
MRFLFFCVLCFSSMALANPPVSEECQPRMRVISGSQFTVAYLEPSTVECGQEILKASSADYILVSASLGGIYVAVAKKGTQSSGANLFTVGYVTSIEEAVSLFCDVNSPIETLDEGSVDSSVFCTPLK